IRTLPVSGLVSTRSMLSQLASRSATVRKKTVLLRFSGTFIRNRRAVKWLMWAAGSSGIRRARLPGRSVWQSHYFVWRKRLVLAARQLLLSIVFGARLGHYIAGQFAHLGRPLAAALVEGDPGLEQPLGRRPEISFQTRQDQRCHQSACETGQHGGNHC